MTAPTLPWAASRFEVVGAGTRPGAACNRPMPIYRRNLLRGWGSCSGIMTRRNGQVRCQKCGRVVA